MQDRPTAKELLEGVKEYLKEEILPDAEGERQFLARVCVNNLDMVIREIDLGEGCMRREWKGLNQVLDTVDDPPETTGDLADELQRRNEELSRRIRESSGEDDPRWGEYLDHVKKTVMDKVRITKPDLLEDEES